MRLWFSALSVLVLLLLALTGCGKGGLVPVKGVVKLDGQPLPNASVLFISQDEGGKDARGYTDANGIFRLATINDDGATPGKYKVVVQVGVATQSDTTPFSTLEEVQKSAGEPKQPAKSPIALRFSHPDQTPIEQEIPAPGEIIIEVKSD